MLEPVSIKPVLLRLLEDGLALGAAEIPVERVHGLPCLPTYGRASASDSVGAFGSLPRDNALADIESRRRLLQFLAESLPQSSSRLEDRAS